MCGRPVLAHPEALRARFALTVPPTAMAPSYTAAPGQDHPAIVATDDQRAARLMRRGPIPARAQDPASGYRTINARAEHVAGPPSCRYWHAGGRSTRAVAQSHDGRRRGADRAPPAGRRVGRSPTVTSGRYAWQPAP